jgi:CheY-like chemotaxis protein
MGTLEKRILVVDDDESVAFFLRESVAQLNPEYQVETAGSGEDALGQLEAGQSYDLVITDLRLPGLSGLELIRYLRRVSPGTRTILITAFGSERIATEARRLKVYRYITKPFSMEDFLRVAHKALFPSDEERAMTEQQRLRELLLSIIFHHLRMPLGYIMGYAGMLAEESERSQQEWAQEILDQAHEMRAALEDLTLFVGWSQAHMPGFLEKVNLGQALEMAAAQLTSQMVLKKQTIYICPTSHQVSLTTDAWLMEVLLLALISSAAKSMREQARIHVEVACDDEVALVTVRGNGGVPPQEPLQEDPLGFSLKVVQSLASAMGGDLRVEADEESKVEICLSVSVGSADTAVCTKSVLEKVV